MSTPRSFARAAVLRCPRCGRRGIFRGWTRLADHCPACGHRYERHEGYWVGAVAINTVVTIVVFFLIFVGGMVLTWPDPPWNVLLIVTVSVNLLFPVAFYPFSKTLWVALDLAIHPPEDHELEDAAARISPPED